MIGTVPQPKFIIGLQSAPTIESAGPDGPDAGARARSRRRALHPVTLFATQYRAQPGRAGGQVIFLMISSISSRENALRVWVRIFPAEPRLRKAAVAVSSSGASQIATMS
jgi:hypothetical protein